MTEEQKSFDWVSLDEGEEILWEGAPRLHSIIPAVIVGVPMIPFIIGLVIIVGAYLNVKHTDFVVTTEGLYRKTGVLSRNVQKIGFHKVQNISFSQGVLGKQFGYGNVEISTAGGSGIEMKFNSIEQPKQVQEMINQQIKVKENQGGVKQKGKDVMHKIFEELRKTRKAVEDIRDNQ